MRPRPKDLAGSCACSPFDAIIARIEALERRATAIVSAVEGIAPDATGNVNLPNSSEIGDALYGRMDAFTMSSVAKTIDDKLEELLLRIGAFDFAGADARIQEATDAVEQVEAELTSYEARITALEEDIISINAHIQAVENDYVEKVGSTMTGPLHIPTNATGTRDDVAVNGNRVQADLDAYEHMVRTSGNQSPILGRKNYASSHNNFIEIDIFTTAYAGWHLLYKISSIERWCGRLHVMTVSNLTVLDRACSSDYSIFLENSVSGFLKIDRANGNTPRIKLCYDSTNGWCIYANTLSYRRCIFIMETYTSLWTPTDSSFKVNTDYRTVVTEPTVDTHTYVIEPTEW